MPTTSHSAIGRCMALSHSVWLSSCRGLRAKGKVLTAGGGGEERDRQPCAVARIQLALPDEIRREEREHEQARVACEERRVAVKRQAEEHGNLDRERRGHGQGKHDERFATGDRLRRGVAVGGEDELLPQPIRVLARELAGEGVQAAHALDRDQERLVLREPRLDEGTHLVAQMRFQFLDIRPRDGAAPSQVGAPLADLFFERRVVGGGAHAWEAPQPEAAQGLVHDLPSSPLGFELRPPFLRQAVVLPATAALRRSPLRRDEPVALQTVQHRIEHAVGPVEMPAGELADAFDDGVAVAVTFGEDGEHERRRRGGDEILSELHT
jgi:hypothetical protein